MGTNAPPDHRKAWASGTRTYNGDLALNDARKTIVSPRSMSRAIALNDLNDVRNVSRQIGNFFRRLCDAFLEIPKAFKSVFGHLLQKENEFEVCR